MPSSPQPDQTKVFTMDDGRRDSDAETPGGPNSGAGGNAMNSPSPSPCTLRRRGTGLPECSGLQYCLTVQGREGIHPPPPAYWTTEIVRDLFEETVAPVGATLKTVTVQRTGLAVLYFE